MSLMNVVRLAVSNMGHNRKRLDDIVDFAHDGQIAVQKVVDGFRNEGIQYGLILSDCQMPIMDGYRACLRIRQEIEQLGYS